MSVSVKESLLLLFERPYEPVFFPKGERGVVFQPPPELLSDRNREILNRLPNRFGGAPTVVVAPLPSTPVSPQPPPEGEVAVPPAIAAARSLPRRAPFSVFIPWHQRLAGGLIQLFMEAGSVEELCTLGIAAREICNPQLFTYAYSVALLHRPDTRDLSLPPLVHVMPEKFFRGSDISRTRVEANVGDTERNVVTIPRDWTASDAEPEHRLAYFREDIGINMHHWHWHLVYPSSGTRAIVDKDRRGEMFYYMHQQIIARYNLERFSLGMARVRRLGSFRDPLKEGYYPKLYNDIAGWNYAGRPDNTVLSDVSRDLERTYFDISDLQRWESRIFDAIHTGTYLTTDGVRVRLTEEGGIDILGNIVEASIVSPNRGYYGDLHNMLHYALGTCHDPNYKHKEMLQSIADPTTSMRDPIFYPLHSYVDDIFLEHKNTLPPYTEDQLALPGLTLTSMSVQSSTVPGESAPPQPGVLRTFLQESEINLTRGLDFAPSGSILVRTDHLQNAPFEYTFMVENSTSTEKRVTVRVFLGPRSDERGTPLLFMDHKNFFVEVDKFVATVPKGASQLRRSSEQSSITIPWEQTFRNVDRNRPADGTPELQQFSYCGCGWPQHMLLPRGNFQGLPCVLFAMLTDFELDKVNEQLPHETVRNTKRSSEVKGRGIKSRLRDTISSATEIEVEDSVAEDTAAGERRCKGAVSFCGLRDRRFPDRRPMGFPFDRRPREDGHYLRDFMAQLPNMRTIDVSVRFTDRVLQRRTADADQATPVE